MITFAVFHCARYARPRWWSLTKRASSFSARGNKILAHPSEILLSSNNEDAASEKLLLNKLSSGNNENRALCALMVAGGGDNFLSALAHDSISHVQAVDRSPVQLAIAQLKLALAVSSLSTTEALSFLGAKNMEHTERKNMYRSELLPHLSDEAAKVINDKIMHEVEHGLIQFGANENLNRLLLELLGRRGFDSQALWDGTVNMEALKPTLCKPGLTNAQEVLGAMCMKKFVPPEVFAHFVDILERGSLVRVTSGHYRMIEGGCRSFIASIALRGIYDEETMPDWLHPETREKIRSKKNQVSFVQSMLAEVEDDPSFDLVSPSNIFDWTPIEASASSLSAVASKFLAPGGLFLLRRAFQGVDEIVELCPTLRVSDRVGIQELAEVDKSPFFYQSEDCIAALEHT